MVHGWLYLIFLGPMYLKSPTSTVFCGLEDFEIWATHGNMQQMPVVKHTQLQ